MASFFQLLVSGLATGAIYALIAVGFTLVWQTSQTINFAQGEFVMLPAFFILAAMNAGAPFWLACLIGIVLSVVILGLLFKFIIVDPMLKYGVLPLVISTIALSLFLKEGAKDFYSSQAQPFPSLVPATDFHVFGIVVSLQSLVVLAAATATVVALHVLLTKTRLGRSMQATAQNPTLARILGIDVNRMVLYTFLINGALVAIASILISPIYLAKFTNGETLGIAAFLAAIIGGFNQVRGAILGGVILGVLDNLSAAYISAQYRGAFPLIILIVVILFRPQGLLGRIEERTV
ncbi:MAG: ABC transporter, permease protein 1 (cluster 4, leucine/isoleucine/valine/benzoate) [Pseudolabrys sp.]|jgi:branched-chain amino acid transport system permease protein|nr:ABC transporter, permease protein 1 (cluster 4, leucine/isoleucine/valine/benzoate) [Pseudolabrys sp.]